MRRAEKTMAAVDAAIEAQQDSGFRGHLGASVIGKTCERELWYIFRWALSVQHSARMLRLFDRGHREEERFVKWLRDAGIHVEEVDPETGKQFRISDCGGHFGGSMDGRLLGVPDLPDGVWALAEFKTSSDKRYAELSKKGLESARRQHFVQMQIYMRKGRLDYALYLAINKNDDDIYPVIVEVDNVYADAYIERANEIIYADGPPRRISESPGWWECRFCDFREVCHERAPLAVNCRTCVYAAPIDDGEWLCTRYSYTLSDAEQRQGCRDHTPYPAD